MYQQSTAPVRSQHTPRRVSKRNASKRRTKAQADLIRALTKQARLERKPIPRTRAAAAKEIDRLFVVLGRKPKTEPASVRKLTSKQRLEVSVQRDLAIRQLKVDVATEQATLKAEAAARRAAKA